MPPLGLLTIAAYLPEDFSIRLIDRNVAAESEADWQWADVVFLSLMLAQREVYQELHETAALKTMLPWGVPEAERTIALLGKDFWRYGVEANRPTLEAFLRYSYEQGLAAKLWRPADLFVPETLEATLV